MRRITVCAIAVLLVGWVALAQLPTGTILGTVKDPSGALVAGAKVTARNTDTNQTRTVTTGDDGAYRMDSLPVGNYEIAAEKTGFKTEVQSGLTLTVTQEANENFVLQVGEMSQTVTVTAEAPLVSTTTSSLGGLVDEQRVVDLPLNGRNYIDLSLLQSGVTKYSNTKAGSLGLIGTVFSSNGAPFRSNNYLLDGATLGDLSQANGASVVGNTMGVDGILEYRVITNNFTADYGMTMGSQMVLVSKGGANQFHGDAFEFLRNSDLDARNFFDLAPSVIGHRLPEFRRNNFGGALGGPIKKDKTFFFGVYEGLTQSLGTTNTTNVLGAGCHGPAGAVITLAECPQLSPTTSVTIAPQMAAFVALYPLPNLTATTFGFGFTEPTTEHYGQMRVDQTISNNDTLFVRYTVDDAYESLIFDFPNSLEPLAGRNQFVTLSEGHTFSTSLLNTARFSFSRTNEGQPTQINVTGPQYSFVTGQQMGEILPAGLTPTGTSTGAPRLDKQNIFTYSDDLDYTRGRHSLKFGVLVNHYQDYILNSGVNKGGATFANVAGFLTGVAQSYQQAAAGALSDRTFHFDAMGFYAQDNWRVTSRVTLNLGLRYEPITTYDEIHGISAAIRNLATDATTTLGPPFKNPSLKNWGPRVGFAWDVFGDGKTALRGGFAELYDLSGYGQPLAASASSTPPFDNLIVTQTVNMTIPFVLPANASVSAAFKGMPYYIQQPHMLEENLTLERRLPGSMALTVAYAGSRGIHLMQYREGNPELPNGVPVSNGVGGSVGCVAPPAGAAINYASQIDGSATSCWLLTATRINPNWSSIQLNPTNGDSLYNALQVGLNKRVSKGLQLQSSYTWSKLIDDAQGAGGTDFNGTANGPTGQDALHTRTDRGPSDLDATNNWRVNGIYQFPSSASFSGFLGKLLNGWWISGILSLQSGYPIVALLSSSVSLDNNATFAASQGGVDRPDLVPGRSNSNITHGVSTGCGTGATRANGGTAIAAGTPLGTPTLWFDPCAFTVQPEGFLGTEGRNILRGPGFANLDFSIVKDTAVRFLGEAGKVEFRTEVFNGTNHPNFVAPGGTVYSGTSEVQNPTSSAGVITATNGNSRQIQFGLKILF